MQCIQLAVIVLLTVITVLEASLPPSFMPVDQGHPDGWPPTKSS